LRPRPIETIGPDPSRAVPSATPSVAPSVTASAPEAPFERAAPTRKPQPEKVPRERYDKFGKPIQ
jgi:hypothetical protein